MSDPSIHTSPSLAPLGYTALAILISLLFRDLAMPKWSPVQDPSKELSFLIFWIMAVLPMLYLSFRRWAQESLQTFFPQVFVFCFIAFGLQTALNAVALGFDVLQVPNAAVMPFVWALPWLALSTQFKMSYSTSEQCKSLLLMLVPLVFVFHALYLMLPAFALTYGNIGAAAATLFGLVAVFYAIVAWKLTRLKRRIIHV